MTVRPRQILLSCSLGGAGHLLPVLDAARALRRLGHEPTLLVAPALAERASDSGVRCVRGAQPPPEVVAAIWDRVRAGPPEAVVGLIDRELFAGRATEAMLGPATELCARLEPDLIIREPCEYATAAVAHRRGIAQLQVAISQARIEQGALENVGPTLERHAPGLTRAIADAPYLSAMPASLDPSPWADTRRYRNPPPGAPAALPDWWVGDTRPLVYVTFGSVLGGLDEAAVTYRTVLEAITGLPVRVLLTTGSAFDPGELAFVPDNVHVERWVPQADVLDVAALVVSHGGSGTVFGALAAGRPQVVCPLFADQTANGRLVARAGAGRTVLGSRPASGGVRRLENGDVAALRSAITETLDDDGCARAARAIATELADAPTLDEVLRALL